MRPAVVAALTGTANRPRTGFDEPRLVIVLAVATLVVAVAVRRRRRWRSCGASRTLQRPSPRPRNRTPTGQRRRTAAATARRSAMSESDAASPTVAPTPTPVPTPVPFPAPLDGVPVTGLAQGPSIAVMIDDLSAAAPAIGASARRASCGRHRPKAASRATWRCSRRAAPASRRTRPQLAPVLHRLGLGMARRIRPCRRLAAGARAAEARPRAQAQLVYNVDQFRWGHVPLPGQLPRFAPHNVYTDGKQLRALASVVGAKAAKSVPTPVWQFAPDAPLGQRPSRRHASSSPTSPTRSATTTTATTNTYPRTSRSRASRLTPAPSVASPRRTSS